MTTPPSETPKPDTSTSAQPSEPPVLAPPKTDRRPGGGAARWAVPLAILAIGGVLVWASRPNAGTPSATPTVTVTVTIGPDGQRVAPGTQPGAKVDNEKPPADAGAVAAKLERRTEGEPGTIGPANAPVVMVAYSDYLCGFCAKWVKDTQPVLIDKYVNSGKLRIEWRDSNSLGGERSVVFAKAATAAGKQGKFWEFHNDLFANGGHPNAGEANDDAMIARAAKVGLDRERFAQDLRSAETAALVTKNMQEAQSIGVTGTPTFVIKGQGVVGAQPTSVFTQIIDKVLAEG